MTGSIIFFNAFSYCLRSHCSLFLVVGCYAFDRVFCCGDLNYAAVFVKADDVVDFLYYVSIS